ncbi:MAG: glutamate--cysteine ligase [Mycobacteriaceae bacterium]
MIWRHFGHHGYMHVPFAQSPRSTIGVEWELLLLDADSADLRQVAPYVLAQLKPEGASEHPQIKQELLINTVELVSTPHRTVAEVGVDLSGLLGELRTVTDPLRVELACAGTHPFSRWMDQEVTDKARYAKLIDRTRWWGRQMLIYGVHVHVGIEHRDKALPILNALLTHAPHLQALSASSPFWVGEQTGYASNRALLFQQLPTAGLPFQFASWSEYEGYVDDMLVTGVIDVVSEIRWDIRPSPNFGTIEVRVCDGIPTLREVLAVTALIQCLVEDLSTRLDNGETLPTLPPWHVQENKWRAARYGTDAIVICDAAGKEREVGADTLDLLEQLAPTARRLGCVNELADIARILETGASYRRQLAVHEHTGGNLRAVARSLISEMRAGLC